MNFFRRNLWVIAVGCLMAVLYRNWFSKGLLTAPDFSYVSPLQLMDLRDIPSVWSSMFGGGLGGSTVNILNLETYLHMGVKFLVFMNHIPWNAAYRLLFFWPFLLIGSVASYYFCYSVSEKKYAAALGMLIYMTNTYVLMLAGGGQVGLMMAYAVAPLTLASFIRKQSVLFVISMGMLLLFDLRFSFLIVGTMLLYVLLLIPIKQWLSVLRWGIIPGLIIIGIHSFWLIPTIFGGGMALPEGYGSAEWLTFLSWAELSKAISLLHPNWPENIFGKTYFLAPEFIAIPLLAFGSLLFNKSGKNSIQRRYVLLFALLALIGVFFAKGVNPPYGAINEWLFLNAPFFNGFRDPTKFYLLITISYSVLIPFSIMQIMELFKQKFSASGKYIRILPLIFIGLWLFTIRSLVVGEVQGTFGKISVPKAYDDFGKFVFSEPNFGRTLVIPWRNRFIYQSENHPAINARDIFASTDIDNILAQLREPSAEGKLKQLAVRYVIVPADFTNEIFLKNREYDPNLRAGVVQILDKLSYLDKKKMFDGLDVYEFTKHTGHFFSILPNLDAVPYVSRKLNPVTYEVDLSAAYRPVDVIFSEAYDPGWELWDGEKYIQPTKTPDGVMAFTVTSDVTGQLLVRNKNQKWVDIGYASTGVVLMVLLLSGYIYVSRKFLLGKRVHVLLIILGIFGFILSIPRAGMTRVLDDKDIYRSAEWKQIYNPISNKRVWVSRYGGAEMVFTMVNSREIVVHASSANNEAHIQGIDINVGGKISTLETPMHDSQIRVDTRASLERPIEVSIKHWCAGTFGPCDLAITDILLDNSAGVEVPKSVRKKTLAVLGDSISVSFGNKNYTYILAESLGYQLHNASIFGSTVVEAQGWDWSMKRYPKDIIAFFPDALLIVLGTNDLLHDSVIFRNNYSSLLHAIKEKSPNTQIITFGLFRRKDISGSRAMSMSRLIASIAEENGVHYIDPYYWLEEVDLQDVVHPSKASQKKLADKMYEALSPLIKK